MFVRKLPAIIAAAGLLVSLSACAASPTSFGDCSGSSASLVKADGTFPTPLVTKKAESAVVKAGDGDQVRSSDAVVLDLKLYDAETGDQLQDPLTIATFVNGNYPFSAATTCATVGSQISTVGTVTELLNPETPSDQRIVIVSTITDAFPAQSVGTDQITQPGFPAVVFTPIGQPGFTFPDGDAPTKLNIAALKQGSGTTVEDGDNIFVNLTGIVWGGTSTFASSWTNLAPAGLVASPLDADGTGVVPGLAKALVGQQVGSRLVVVVPPSDGYSEAQLPTGVTATDTLVFVVDILAIG